MEDRKRKHWVRTTCKYRQSRCLSNCRRGCRSCRVGKVGSFLVMWEKWPFIVFGESFIGIWIRNRSQRVSFLWERERDGGRDDDGWIECVWIEGFVWISGERENRGQKGVRERNWGMERKDSLLSTCVWLLVACDWLLSCFLLSSFLEPNLSWERETRWVSLLGAGALGRSEDSLPPDVVYFF